VPDEFNLNTAEVRCTRVFSLGITGERDYPAEWVVLRHQALETGVILPELAAS
jgi:hypothetical protein